MRWIIVDKKVPVVRFKGFTDDWEQHKLGDLIENYYNGQTPSRNKVEYWGGTLNWLTSGELNRGIVTKTKEKITEIAKNKTHLKVVPKGTFVIAITGLEAEGTRGNCAILGIDTTLNQSCMALFTNSNLIKVEFLFQWYRKRGNEFGIRYTQGTKQQSYNATILNILPISVPSLSEQERIQSILLQLDNIIALYQEQLHFYEKLKKTLLQNMFANTHRSKPVIRFSKFHDSWEPRELNAVMSDFIVPMRDKPKQFGGTIPWTRIDDIDGKYLNESKSGNYVSTETIKSMNLKVIPKNSLIVSASATFGVVAIVTNDLVTNQTFIGLVPKPSYNLEFLFNLFKTPRIQKLMRIESVGSTIFYISRDKFKKMNCNVPTLKEQNLIGKICRSVDEFIALYQTKLNYMNSEKEYLLQKLFI